MNMSSRTKQKRQTYKSPAMIIAGVLLLAVVITGVLEAAGAIHILSKSPSHSSGPTASQAKEQAAGDARQKQNSIENPRKVASTPPIPDTNNISLSTQKGTPDTITVFTNVGNISDGTCTLVTTNGNKQNTQTAAVIFQSQYSTCAGFTVPITALGAGNWSLKLTVTSNGGTASRTITQVVQ